MNPSPRQLLLQGLAALRERHQRAQRRAAVHHVMPDDNWYDPGPVKPRQLDPNSRCPDCKTGPMFPPRSPVRAVLGQAAGWSDVRLHRGRRRQPGVTNQKWR